MAETEKITINMSVVDLGQIDLLVEEGFFSNRTDFIRTAIRNLLNTHQAGVERIITRKSLSVGATGFNRHELEDLQRRGEQLEIQVVGLFVLKPDVTPELAKSTIKSLKVFGAFHASDEVKAALADRILA